jgi:hypothetical protein
MNLVVTAIILFASVGSTVVCGWLGARPRGDLTRPRLVPWQFLMLLAAAVSMMMLVHALNLIGVKTGGANQ